MRTARYDVVIIGSGAGGGTMAKALAETSARILILERGAFVPQEPENRSPVWPSGPFASVPRAAEVN